MMKNSASIGSPAFEGCPRPSYLLAQGSTRLLVQSDNACQRTGHASGGNANLRALGLAVCPRIAWMRVGEFLHMVSCYAQPGSAWSS